MLARMIHYTLLDWMRNEYRAAEEGPGEFITADEQDNEWLIEFDMDDCGVIHISRELADGGKETRSFRIRIESEEINTKERVENV